jgi:tRNA and rRNA cytosine-C5-methylases
LSIFAFVIEYIIMDLPIPFIDYTRSLIGDEEYNKLYTSLQAEPLVTIRLNRAKCDDEAYSKLRSMYKQVPWCEDAFYLNRRLTFTFDPLFHAGYYYVQEASSMFVGYVLSRYLDKEESVTMLDLCAAPGGKSTHVRSVLPSGSLLVTNEVIRNRAQILAENLIKWGNSGVVVTNNDPSDFSALPHFFDVVLADVPCSGEGMFRKDATAIDEWTAENVDLCWQRQRRIISDMWGSLKPGGLLIYSTCTYNTKENEENVAWICEELGAEVLKVDVPQDWNITGNLLQGSDFPVYRFLPHRTDGEGFFLAVIRKKEIETSSQLFVSQKEMRRDTRKKSEKSKNTPLKISYDQWDMIYSWVTDSGAYEWNVAENKLSAFPQYFATALPELKSALRVVHAGLPIGEFKGKDLIPHHALSMNVDLSPERFARAEISYEQAIAYLRKESIVLSPDIPLGYTLLMYHSVPLGFVKNIGNRANNLYPQEWRIRSGYLPERLEVLLYDI